MTDRELLIRIATKVEAVERALAKLETKVDKMQWAAFKWVLGLSGGISLAGGVIQFLIK